MNVRDAITEIRNRTHDRESLAWEDPEVLEVMDNRLRHMTTKLRTAGDSIGLDYVDVVPSAMTFVSANLHFYTLPEWLYDIQLIEGMREPNSEPSPFYKATLEDKELWRQSVPVGTYRWAFGRRRQLQLFGTLANFNTIRIWFVRLIPGLFYATVTSGDSTHATLNAKTAFAFKNRTGLYDSFEFEVTADTGGAANVEQVRRCDSFTSNILTFDAAWPAPLSATTNLAMVIPLPEEHLEFYKTMVVKKLFERSGSEDDLALAERDLTYLQGEFESGIARVSTGEPPRLISSRRTVRR